MQISGKLPQGVAEFVDKNNYVLAGGWINPVSGHVIITRKPLNKSLTQADEKLPSKINSVYGLDGNHILSVALESNQ